MPSCPEEIKSLTVLEEYCLLSLADNELCPVSEFVALRGILAVNVTPRKYVV